MDIYAQHGFGKSDKIERGIRSGDLSGVILSPRDEDPEAMLSFVASLRQEFDNRVVILFDPQFYASTLSPVRDLHLPEYRSYYRSGLTRAQFVSQREVHRYVEETLTYQSTLDLDRIISPTVFFSDFRDPWSQIALFMAQESVSCHAEMELASPLLLSFVFHESALRNIEAINEFLDIISLWEVQGFYLIVHLDDSNYPAFFEESLLANLMYLVYVLSEINAFEAICGYTDFVGFLLQAVGAHASGTGWFQSLRQFSLNRRFMPQSGGRRARDRYTTAPLLNSIFIIPELVATYDLGLIDHVLSNTSFDSVMRSGNPANCPWPPDISCLHHWQVLAEFSRRASSQPTLREKLGYVEDSIRQGIAAYRLLESRGVPFETMTGSRDLELKLRAIQSFRRDNGL